MFSRFQKATSQNIVFVGANQAIGPDALATTTNQNKFLKVVNGTAEWISLPLPDVNTATQTQDGYFVVFDYASKSFILKQLKLPYYASQDALIRFLFMPDANSTVFTSGTLTQIKNQ